MQRFLFTRPGVPSPAATLCLRKGHRTPSPICSFTPNPPPPPPPPQKGSLNRYLVKHHLYTCAAGDCNNLVLPAPEAFTNAVSFVAEQRPPPALPTLQAMVQQQTHLALAHVRNASHFVLLTGVSGPAAKGVFAVNDPGFAQATYAYAEMADVILYRIVPAAERAAVRVPHAFPLFKQCNSSWGSDVMEKQTICDVGCLMSSCSMALRGNGVALGDGKHNTIAANPGTLNTWLRNNHGYTSGDDLDESALPRINATAVRWPSDGMHTANDLPYMTIRAYQLQGRTVIANVMQGHHFVLVTGWNYTDPDMVLVNDPGFDRASYSYSKDVVGWRLFDIMDRASWPASL